MNYKFSYYEEKDYDEMLQLALNSYKWEYPICGMSRLEFAKGLHPAFTGHYHAWQHTVAIYRENGKMVACVWNEGNYEGEVFFLFDSKERGEDKALLKDMLKFAKTHVNGIKNDRRTKYVNLFIPEWNGTLHDMALEAGFNKSEIRESLNILPFGKQTFEVKLPHGYSIVDGNETPDFYLSNTHRFSFGYGGNYNACEHGEEAFHNLRKMKNYRKNLDLCVLDEQSRPVAMAIIWYDESMPYCELEPLGVVWWERRKGIATALLHEAANRVMAEYPECNGMLGGDQQFYRSISYERMATIPCYRWELEVFISWEKESSDKYYAKEV